MKTNHRSSPRSELECFPEDFLIFVVSGTIFYAMFTSKILKVCMYMLDGRASCVSISETRHRCLVSWIWKNCFSRNRCFSWNTKIVLLYSSGWNDSTWFEMIRRTIIVIYRLNHVCELGEQCMRWPKMNLRIEVVVSQLYLLCWD